MHWIFLRIWSETFIKFLERNTKVFTLIHFCKGPLWLIGRYLRSGTSNSNWWNVVFTVILYLCDFGQVFIEKVNRLCQFNSLSDNWWRNNGTKQYFNEQNTIIVTYILQVSNNERNESFLDADTLSINTGK